MLGKIHTISSTKFKGPVIRLQDLALSRRSAAGFMDSAAKSCSPSEKCEEARSRSKGGLSLLRAAAAEAAALSQYERECEVVQFGLIFSLERKLSRNM